jgi:hypothetical protein
MEEDKHVVQDKNGEMPLRVGWKDVLAIMIAQFEILMPMALGAIGIMSLLVFLLLRVWIKS